MWPTSPGAEGDAIGWVREGGFGRRFIFDPRTGEILAEAEMIFDAEGRGLPRGPRRHRVPRNRLPAVGDRRLHARSYPPLMVTSMVRVVFFPFAVIATRSSIVARRPSRRAAAACGSRTRTTAFLPAPIVFGANTVSV